MKSGKLLSGAAIVILIVVGIILIYQNHTANVQRDCASQLESVRLQQEDPEKLPDRCRVIYKIPTHAQEREAEEKERKAEEICAANMSLPKGDVEYLLKAVNVTEKAQRDSDAWWNNRFSFLLSHEKEKSKMISDYKHALDIRKTYGCTSLDDWGQRIIEPIHNTLNDGRVLNWDNVNTGYMMPTPHDYIVGGLASLSSPEHKAHKELCQKALYTDEELGLKETFDRGDLPMFASEQSVNNFKKKRIYLRKNRCDGLGNTTSLP